MRPEKTLIVDDLRARLQSSPFLIVTDYTGMTVVHFEELRTRLGAVGAKCSVVKNTFLKIAAKELGMPELNGSLAGQTAIITGEKDICAAAKTIKTFAAEFTKPVMKAGILDNSILSADQIKVLADLPPKEVLQATLLGVLLAPATKLVRVFNEPAASLARVLKAHADAMPAPVQPAKAEAPAAQATPAAAEAVPAPIEAPVQAEAPAAQADVPPPETPQA